MRSTSAGCRWTTVGTVQSTSDGFPISLVAARGDRAFAWADNRNDLARIDGTTITYLGSPVDSIIGVGTDPENADRLRFVDGGGQMWESTDGGLRFGPIGARIQGSAFLYYRAAFDPSNLDHVVVGAVIEGAYVTFDGGRNWTRASGLSSTGTGAVNVFSVVVSPALSTTVYAMGLDIVESDAGAASQGRHIYMSEDGGLTFRSVVDRSADVILPNGVPMAAHPTNAAVVYFSFGSSFGGYGADLYRYDDDAGQVTKTHNDYHGLPDVDAAAQAAGWRAPSLTFDLWPSLPDTFLVPLVTSPDTLLLVVAGGDGRHSSWFPAWSATQRAIEVITTHTPSCTANSAL
jgi:hypothetical protein